MEILGSLGKKRVDQNEKNRAALASSQFISTGFGIGYLPLAPGTWASILTTLIWFGVYQLESAYPLVLNILVVILLVPVAWISASLFSKAIGKSDPSIIVIDEILGQSICFLFMPHTWQYFLAGLTLFRLFDILKPPPARQSERIAGGLGIMMDDVVAGLYAGLILWLFHAS